ncbi:GFA family protein [Pyruvatibacter sp.]|uniref:GFA family protein n=1 Tax=Pyruvatibacter sp. TaxID=1981328 RepID=UPI0032EAEF9E
MTQITGSCRCGEVTYTSTAAPVFARICWCRTCQRYAAGMGTVNVVFPSDTFKINGHLRDDVSTADSGNVIHRGFCPLCGTHMFSEAEVRPHLVGVRAGTLDDQSIVRPTANIWASQAPPWAILDDTLERFEGQPPA